MKKIKILLLATLLGVISFSVFPMFDNLTMSDGEKFLLENIEALTTNEGGWNSGTNGTCGVAINIGGDVTIECNISYASAMSIFNSYDSNYVASKNWCCDNCYQTWYCGSRNI